MRKSQFPILICLVIGIGLIGFGKSYAQETGDVSMAVFYSPPVPISIGYPFLTLVIISPDINKAPLEIEFDFYKNVAVITGPKGSVNARIEITDSFSPIYSHQMKIVSEEEPNRYENIFLMGDAKFERPRYSTFFKADVVDVTFEMRGAYSGRQFQIYYGSKSVKSILIGGREAKDLFRDRTSKELTGLTEAFAKRLQKSTDVQKNNCEAFLK